MTTAPQILPRGVYRSRLAATSDDLDRILRLRGLAFHCDARRGDWDRFDALWHHAMIEDGTGALVGSLRFSILQDARALSDCYAAQAYDLTPLGSFGGPFLELGRVCLHPDRSDPDILRAAWALLTREVDRVGARLLFGCASFRGTDPAPFRAALAFLGAHHLGPSASRPRARPVDSLPLPTAAPPEDPRRARALLPPLLRSYLGMGGWVGDHAVIDREMETLHVFTAVETARIPAARAARLRALARHAP